MSLLDTIGFAVRTAQLAKPPAWSPARCQRVARRRLAKLVRHAVAHSAYYSEKYRGLALDDIRLDALPVTTKDELRSRFDDVVTDPAVRREEVEKFLHDPANIGRWYLGKYAVSHTSGSQGAALSIVQDRRAVELLFSIMSARANVQGKPGIIEGWRRLRNPARVAVVALHRGFYPSAAAFEFMGALTRPFSQIAWFSATQPDLVEQLNEFQPNTLVGYASVLEGLALAPAGLHLNALRQIANSSEQLTDRARQRIEGAFRVPVLDHYGIGECLFLSDGCPTDGGAHINADWSIVEVVDENYRPVPAGQAGQKVLVTNLANYVQPFIRYEVNDRVVMASEPCGCGSRLPRIARIEGRSSEAFWYVDAQGTRRMLPGVLFHNAIDSVGSVQEWRAIQTDMNHIELQLEFLDDAEQTFDAQSLVRQLRNTGLPDDVDVDIEPVVGLRPDWETCKYRRMISRVSSVGETPSDVTQADSAA